MFQMVLMYCFIINFCDCLKRVLLAFMLCGTFYLPFRDVPFKIHLVITVIEIKDELTCRDVFEKSFYK